MWNCIDLFYLLINRGLSDKCNNLIQDHPESPKSSYKEVYIVSRDRYNSSEICIFIFVIL